MPYVHTLLEDLRLTGRSFRAAPTVWLGVILAGSAMCVAAAWAGKSIGGSTDYAFGEFRARGLYEGMMTAVSSFFMGAGAMALFAVAAIQRRRHEPQRVWLSSAVAALGLFVMGADDLLMLHEWLGYRLARMGWPLLFGRSYDAYGALLYAVAALLVLPPLLTTLRRHWRALFPLVFALAMFVVAVVVNASVPLGRLSPALHDVFSPLDRMAKTLGTIMVFAFAQTLLVSVATESEGNAP